jgi:hypothetical protein
MLLDEVSPALAFHRVYVSATLNAGPREHGWHFAALQPRA